MSNSWPVLLVTHLPTMSVVFTTHTRHNFGSLCVLAPGWVTTSLVSCGSKAPGHWGRWVWVARTFGLTVPNFSLFSPIYTVTCRVYHYQVQPFLTADKIPFMRSTCSFSSALNLPTRLAVKNERFPRGRTAGYRAQVGHQDKPPYCSCLKRWCSGRGHQGELIPERSWHRAPELCDTVLVQVASSEPHSIQVPNRE